MPRIVVLGEALIDVFAEKGVPLREARTLSPAPGGAPANAAVALARLGAEVGFIGKVGTDDFGAFLIDYLAQAGVDTTHLKSDPRAPTMLAIVASPSPTEQQFVLYNGASVLLAPEDLSQAYIASARIFVYNSVTLPDAARTAAWQAVEWVREAGGEVIFDVNLRPAQWPDLELARQRMKKSVASASVVKLNETELEFLTGSPDPAEGSRHLLDQGVQLCCVSLGAEGAYFNNGRASGFVPVFAVEVRDTTGSGDAFVGGLAFQLSQLAKPLPELDEPTLRRCVTFANACGAMAATQIGAMTALPTLEQVEQLLQANR